MKSVIAQHMAEVANEVERALASVLPTRGLAEARLFDAMRYGTLGGGKRLRPFLALESAKMFGVNPNCALRVAMAVEFVHCYSIIHDDLPAMDNGVLRRGKPTVHRHFDESTAILAGDALLAFAFEIMAHPETHEDPNVRCSLTSGLARASGPRGMAAGQMLDMIAQREELDMGAITRMQRLKTGELIAFACESGAILGRVSHPQRQALSAYAHNLGLAFQIVDDLLDAEGTEQETGKSVGRDVAAGKTTFVSILGVERARAQAEILANQAIGHLDMFEDRAHILRMMPQYVLERRK